MGQRPTKNPFFLLTKALLCGTIVPYIRAQPSQKGKIKMILSPAQIAEKCVDIGTSKSKLPIHKMILLGILAGMFIAIAGIASSFGNVFAGKLPAAMIFSAGLVMVLVAGSELFTGNCLMVCALLDRKIKIGAMLKNWLFVYIGNLIGATIVALIVVASGAIDSVSDFAINASVNKVNIPFFEAFLRGLLCNFLVCIAVWMSFATSKLTGKVLAVFWPITIFVFCGFEHSIANMYFIPAGIFQAIRVGKEPVSVLSFFVDNLLPVTLGNIVGGALMVAVGYYFVYLHKRKA